MTSAATYYVAETYFDFSRSLAESERPADLSPAELQEYERVLEEEAYPFEEKAIDFHKKNLEVMRDGIFNTWIEKSLGRLAEMVPGRYAKKEASNGFLGEIDSFVYRHPVQPVPAAPPGAPDTAPPGEPAPSTHTRLTAAAPWRPRTRRATHRGLRCGPREAALPSRSSRQSGQSPR